MNTKNNLSQSEKCELLHSAFRTLRTRGIIKTWADLAGLLDVNPTSLSSAKNGKENYLTDSLISKVSDLLENYNNPNKYEVGSPRLGTEPEEGISALAPASQELKFVPTIPIHAYRAVNFDVMEYFATTTDKLHLSPIVLQFPKTDCYYFVNSEDMSPELRSNDMLCLSKLPEGASVTNGEIYIINTKYQGIIGRYVYDDGDFYLVKSNQTRWTDMRIPKEEVFSVFRILGGIRTNI